MKQLTFATNTKFIKGSVFRFLIGTIHGKGVLMFVLLLVTLSYSCYAQECTAVTIGADNPYVEDFESYEKDAVPSCWNIMAESTGTYKSSVKTTPVKEGTKSFVMAVSYYCKSPMCALPEFTNDLSELRIRFYGKKQDKDKSGNLEIGYVTDVEDTSTFVTLKTIQGSTDWELYTIDLSYYSDKITTTNGTPILAMRQKSSATTTVWWAIDSLAVSLSPACKEPSDVVAKNITGSSAKLTWLSTATKFNITVKDNNGEEIAVVYDITENEYKLTELMALTQYTATIEGFCEDETPTEKATITFKTACSSLTTESLPYSMNFESETANSNKLMDVACWTVLEKASQYTTEMPNIINYSAHSGSNCMKLTNSTYNGNMVALPNYQGNIKDLQLFAYIKPNSNNPANGQLEIGVLTDLTDTSTFHVAKVIVAEDLPNKDYQLYEIKFCDLDLEIEESAVYYPAIKAPSKSAQSIWFIDNIVLDKIPVCPAPHNTAVTNITSNSAEVTWSQYGEEASEWMIYYKKISDVAWTTESANTKPWSLTDLTPATNYELKVASLCGQNYLESNEIIAFTTACVNLTMEALPYFNSFEECDNGEIPACWTTPIFYKSGNITYPNVATAVVNAHTGNNYMYLSNNNKASLMITLNGYQGDITELQLVAWARPQNTDATFGKLQVGFVTDVTDTSTFVVVQEYNATDWTGSVYKELITPFNTLEDFTADADAVYYPAIKYVCVGLYKNWYIDDITLEAIPECAKPLKVAVEEGSITSTSATITWQQPDENTSWAVYYKKTDEAEYQYKSVINTPSSTLTDLTPLAIYDVYVEVVCNENTASNHIQFKTDCPEEFTVTAENKYIEDFESYPVNTTSPDCWTNMTPCDVANNSSKVTTNPVIAGKQSFNLYIPAQSYGATGTTQPMYALPKFSNSLETLRLSFYSKRSNSACGDLQIGYLTDLTDSSTFVALKVITSVETSNDWTRYKIDMSEYSETITSNDSENKYLAIRHDKPEYTGYLAVYYTIDSLVVSLTPSCADPTDLVVSDIEETTANVSWISEAASHKIKIVIEGTNEVFAEQSDITENSFTIEGLTENTSYIVTITGVCENGDLTDPITTSFHTHCSAMEIPWSTSFEDLNSTSLYYCWTKVSESVPSINNSDARTGKNCLNFITPPGKNSIIALPRFAESINNLRVTFYSKPKGTAADYGRMRVGVTNSLNISDTADITYIWEKSATQYASSSWNEEVVDFGNIDIEGENIYIIFNHDNSSSKSWNIDDISVDLIPDCDKARNLTISDITAESATISWTIVGSQKDFTVKYKKSEDMAWSETKTTDLSVSLTELSDITEYQVYVINKCSDESVKNSDTIKFTTPCAAITIDENNNYEQNFESYNNYDRVDCWQIVDEATLYKIAVSTTIAAVHEGQKGLLLSTHTTTPKPTIALPHFTNDLSALRIRFYAKSESLAGGNLELGYITDVHDPSTFVTLTSWPKTQTTWTECKVDLNAYEEQLNDAGTFATLALRQNFVGNSSYRWGIDDVVVSLIPVCTGASAIMTTNITDNSATISWTSTASAFNITVKDDEDNLVANVENHVGTTYDLTELNANTTYNVSITGICDDESLTETVTYSFKTLCSAYTISENDSYVDDFETYGMNTYPDCWAVVADGSIYKSVITKSAKSGEYSLSLTASNLEPACKKPIIALPAFATDDLSSLRVQFYAKSENDKSGNLEFGYLTDLSDSSTFVVLKSWPNTMTSWSLCKVDLSLYSDLLPANTDEMRLALRHNSNITTSFARYLIDSIVVKISPECIEPTEITANEITTNSVVLNWASSSSEFNVVIEDMEGNQIVNEQVYGEPTYYTNILTENTVYRATIKSICGDTESDVDETTRIKFRTACIAITKNLLPITWNFESDIVTENSLPSCWQRITANTTPSVNNYEAYEGQNCLYFSSYKDGIVAMKEIDATIPVNSLQLSFYAKRINPYYAASLNVGVMTDPTDQSTLTIVETITLTNTYTKYEVPFNDYEGEGAYITLSVASSNTDFVCVDNVEIDKATVCDKITDVSFTSTTTTATIILNDAVSDLTYKIYYRLGGSTDEYTAVTAVAGSAAISGLTAGTTYEYYVESVCTEGANAVSTTYTFKTTCDAILVTDTTPWEEDFAEENALNCWINLGKWQISGFNELQHNKDVAPSLIVSPTFDLTGVTDPYITFQHVQYMWFEGSSSTPSFDTLKVLYRTSLASEWTELESYHNGVQSLINDTLALPNKSASCQIGFKFASGGGNGVKVDNIKIFNKTEVLPCDAPTSLTVTSKTQTSATITWAGSATSYDVQLGSNASVNVTATTYTFDNLTAGTSYTAKVRANCGETTSDWVSVTFTTEEEEQPTCEKVTNLTATPTYNSVILTWNGDAASYDVQLGNNASVNVTTTSHTFNNLTASTTYTAKVRANCGNGLTSEWESINFTTDAEPSEDCDAPTNVTANEITQTTAVISWEGTAETYEVTVGDKTPVNVSAKSYACSGLTANTTYTVKVRSICGDGKMSEAATATFKTLKDQSGLTDVENELSVKVYPNPTTDNATLEIKGINGRARLIVTDVNGRVIDDVNVSDGVETITINSERYASGVYYVRVMGEGINKTTTLIKK